MQLLFVQGAGKGSYDWDLPLIKAIGEKLDQKFTLHYPKMPKEEEPTYELWKQALLKEIEGATEPLAIIGHSHGGSVILKLLSEEKIPKDIRALFLVSTPFWGEPDWQSETYVLDDDFADKLPVIAHQFIYHAEDDDIVHFEHHKRYSAKLPNAKVRTFGRGGHDRESDVDLLFLTNNMEMSALEVAKLYRNRWQIETFFKWIKQNLAIKKLWEHSENAVNTHIGAAICTYLVVAHVKHSLKNQLSI